MLRFLALACLVTSGAIQAAPPEEPLAKVFEEWSHPNAPGGAVLVWKGGQTLFRKASGLACLERELPITPATVFDAGMLAQPITAMALARLEEQGKLSLKDDVRKHLPDLPDYGTTLTLEHLLDQSSGLPDWMVLWALRGGLEEDVISRDAVLGLLRQQKTLAFTPGSRTQASGSNYVLLAEVVRKVTGKSFREWATRELFQPLGMKRTTFKDEPLELMDFRAFNYGYNRQGYRRGPDSLGVVGSHGLWTTLDDMGKWLASLPTSALAKVKVVPERPWQAGFKVDTWRGAPRLTCLNTWGGGLMASLEYFPEQAFGVVVLSNWNHNFYDQDTQLQEINKAFLPLPEPPVVPRPPVAAPSPDRLAALAGEFRMGTFPATIAVEKDQLCFKVQGQTYPLAPVGEDRFTLAIAGAELHFLREGDGTVRRLEWTQGGRTQVATRALAQPPSAEELAAFTGDYENASLEARWQVLMNGPRLVLRHWRRGDRPLMPVGKDAFTAADPFGDVVFERDAQQRITGFRLTSPEAAGITFKKR